MKNKIIQSLDSPEKLEKLYRADPESFKSVIL
jgi:hypothetical protein